MITSVDEIHYLIIMLKSYSAAIIEDLKTQLIFIIDVKKMATVSF